MFKFEKLRYFYLKIFQTFEFGGVFNFLFNFVGCELERSEKFWRAIKGGSKGEINPRRIESGHRDIAKCNLQLRKREKTSECPQAPKYM